MGALETNPKFGMSDPGKVTEGCWASVSSSVKWGIIIAVTLKGGVTME